MYDILELSKKLLPELREIGKELNIKRVESFKKQDLIYKILDKQAVTASETRKPENKVIPRVTNPEQTEHFSKEERFTAANVNEKPAGNKKVEVPVTEPIVERQPLIRPFPKRVEKARDESIDS